MAALIGYLDYGHHAGTIHRLAHRHIASRLATWQGEIQTLVSKDGTFEVNINGKNVLNGNINREAK